MPEEIPNIDANLLGGAVLVHKKDPHTPGLIY
jgi:hypothetical protein